MSGERDIQVRLASASLSGDELDIQKVVGTDELSTLFSYTVEASRMPGAAVDEDALLLQPASLVFTKQDGEEIRTVYGLISKVREVAEPQTMAPRLQLTLVPRAFAATMREMLDIFMEMTVPEIVEACLTRCGLEAGEHFDLGGLEDTYAKKEFIVQYRETDFAFISRLCEHHGIFFFVDHSQGKDVLTFGDRNTIFPTSERTPELPFRPIDSEHGELYEHIQSVHLTRTPLPKRYTVRDYNYRIPGVDLMSSADVDPNGLGEIIEYGAHFKGPNEGQWYADIRAQELRSRQRIYTCLGTAPATCAGQKITLMEHPSGDIELLVTAVTHSLDESDGGSLGTTITAIAADTPFRPERRTPKPHVHGIITGIIDAGVQDGYADIDDQGRYRVRFMFDTAGRGEGQASRLVRMAQPHAGEGYGMHFPLRPGTEVILSCIDGDPDRPIITGTVPNPSTASPVSSANRDRNLMRTGGGNEIDISDEDGAHRIKMSTPHMGTVFQLGAPNAAEVGAIISTSGNMVSQVADTVGAMSDFKSAIQDIAGSVTGRSVTSVAGVPNPITGFEAVDKLLQSGSKAASSLASTVDSVAQFGKKLNDSHKKQTGERKKAAENAILALDPPQKYPNNAQKTTVGTPPNQFEVMETEEQFRKRVTQERVASGAATADHRSELESATADAGSGIYMPIPGTDGIDIDGSWGTAYTGSGVKSAVDSVNSVLGTAAKVSATAKKLFSTSHKTVQKAIDAAAWAGAQVTAGGSMTAIGAAAPRRSFSPRLPGKHYHLSAATDSAVLEGAQGFYGLSPLQSHVYGGNLVTIGSTKRLGLFGGFHLEMASKLLMITGTSFVDVESRKLIKMKSGEDTTMIVGKKLTVTSDDDTRHESKKKFFMKTVDLLDVDGGNEAKMKAKKWSVEATEADYKTKTKGKFDVESEGWIQLKHNGKARFFANGANAMMENMKGGKFAVGGSNAKSSVEGGGSIDVTKTSVTVEAKTSFNLNASKISLNGKVLLG